MTVSAAPIPGQVRFALSRPALAWLVIRIGLLNLLTLGFYRFWGKTRLRRSFWSAASLGGEPFEYTGRPVELLIGFLIAIAVLTPLYGAISLIPLVTPDEDIAAVLQLPVFFAFALLWPFAIYRARRYRLTRTLWRGVRFGQDGSAARYALLSIGYWLLVAITLGLAYPWMRVALQRYKMRQTRYGQAYFEFDARGRALIAFWLAAWTASVLALVALVGVAVLARGLEPADPEALGDFFEENTQALIVRGSVYGLALVLSALLYLHYSIVELRVFAGATRLSGVALEARPRFVSVLTIVLIALALAVVTIALAILAAAYGFALGANGQASWAAAVFPLLAVAASFFILFPMIRYVFLYAPVLHHLAATLAVSDLTALDAIAQDQRARPQTGEGLADALDVGGL